MFRNLFGPQGWERLGFRLKEKAVDVLDYEFDFLSRVMKAHRLFDHPYFLNPLYGGLSASKQGEVLALILYEKALEVMIKNNKFDHEDSKTMSGYSIKLDPSDSNLAWLLESVFMAADDSVSNELLHAHIPRALYATNHIAEKYKALLNINTPELYGLHAVRAPILYLTLEQRAKENLSEEDLTTLLSPG